MIHLGCTQRRVIGAGAFQGVAELQQIALCLRIAFQQVQQRIAEHGAQPLADIVASALATDQQPLGAELLDRLAQ